MRKTVVSFCGIALAVSAGCTGPAPQQKLAPSAPDFGGAVAADKMVSRTYPERDADLIPYAKHHLSIRKSAFGKEFLFHGSAIPQQGLPTSTGLHGRVVTFQKNDDKVLLLETTDGSVVTKDLPSTMILAQFPVVNESADAIVVNFNAGMREALITSGWYAADYPSEYQPAAAARLTNSYIQSIALHAPTIEIRQIARVADGPNSVPFEFRYFFTPYRPNPEFIPREHVDFDHLGYFQAPPTMEEKSGRTSVKITRRDHSQPITYHISANTPSEYVQAIKDGVLYWNKAFGREILRAELAPEGVTAPDPRYNIIQWVPFDAEFMAYADALLDPRSGEILHSQVYLLSGIANIASSELRAELRKPKVDGPAMLRHESVCSLDLRAEWRKMQVEMRANGLGGAAADRVIQNYLGAVVAHEVGHTLGLRHNFAGSLAANVPLAEKWRLFQQFALGEAKPSPEMIFTSSVMDYSTIADWTLAMEANRSQPSALPYDAAAIAWGYEGKELKLASAPLFCTDSHVGTYRDCKRFDEGPDPLSWGRFQLEGSAKRLASRFLEGFLQVKTARDARDRHPLERVKLDPADDLEEIGGLLEEQLQWFGAVPKTVASITVDRQFPFVSELKEEERQALQGLWVERQLENTGGVDGTVFPFLPAKDRPAVSFAKESMQALEALLARENVRAGVGYDGKPYSLSEEEMTLIKERAVAYFKAVEEKLPEILLEKLAAITFGDKVASYEIEKGLKAVAQELILAQASIPASASAASEQSFFKKWFTNPPKVFPVFKYKTALRKQAAALLAAARGITPQWSYLSRVETAEELTGVIEKAFGVPFNTLSLKSMSPEQRAWYLDQVQILSAIGAP